MMKRFILLTLAATVLTIAAVQDVSAQQRVMAEAPKALRQGGTVDNAKVNTIDDGQQGTTGGSTTGGGSSFDGGHWVYYYRVRYINGQKFTSCIPYKRVWVE
ncbi:hypothetical protein FACS189454_08970 [Planctomycetales bacterium]|nr:hypothetical protein FACS189454_08970 [Planctomycetales bacterium]